MEKAKIKNERRWGSALGVVGEDLVRPLSLIESVLSEILQEKEDYDKMLESRGVDVDNDALHRRYLKLSCDLGALHSVLTGGNVMMSGIICDMLEDYVMNKNCN